MKPFLIFVLFIFVSQLGFGQKEEVDTFFSQFENGFYKDLTKAIFFIVDSIVDLSEINFKKLYSSDSSLTADDINFLANSIGKKTRLIWTNQTFNCAKIKSRKKLQSLQSIVKKTTRNTSIAYFELSLPYFNRAKDVCFIYCSFYCGRLCFEGCFRLYKKIKGDWTLIDKHGCVVS